MALISINVYVDELDDMIDQYNNTHHRRIKMKAVDVKDNAYIESSKEVNDKDYCVRISKYKSIFCERIHSKLV